MSSEEPPALPPAAALFLGGTYPSQLADGPVDGCHGEYRGFFPRGGGVWNPKGSQFGSRGTGHPGIDIYAPYAPLPLETPVRALFDGKLTCRYEQVEPNKIGNRAEIRPAGKKKVFSYGHLARFEGRSRNDVKAGEIIGYAGCTGNADTERECSRPNSPCNVNAGHLHLSVRDESKSPAETADPLSHVALRLRIDSGGADADLARERPCSKWVTGGSGLQQPWQPPPPDAKRRRLAVQEKMDWRRADGNRVPLPEPFALLEFDSTAQLRASHAFYKLCSLRLEKLSELESRREELGLSAEDKELKTFLSTRAAVAVAAFPAGAESALTTMRARIVREDRGVIGLGAADAVECVPGWLLRHVSVLEQMLWLVCGGAALNHLASNVASTEKDAVIIGKEPDQDPRYMALPLLSKKGFTQFKCSGPLECGAGVGGSAWMSVADGSRSALHLTGIRTGEGDQAQDRWVSSVTFGAGSLMHATVSERMADPAFGGSVEEEPVEQAIGAYLDKLFLAFAAIVQLHWLAHRHGVHLSNEGSGDSAAQARIEVLEEIERAIGKALDALDACPAFLLAHQDLGLPHALMRRMAASNVSSFDALIAESLRTEGAAPIGPALYMLHAERPNEK